MNEGTSDKTQSSFSGIGEPPTARVRVEHHINLDEPTVEHQKEGTYDEWEEGQHLDDDWDGIDLLQPDMPDHLSMPQPQLARRPEPPGTPPLPEAPSRPNVPVHPPQPVRHREARPPQPVRHRREAGHEVKPPQPRSGTAWVRRLLPGTEPMKPSRAHSMTRWGIGAQIALSLGVFVVAFAKPEALAEVTSFVGQVATIIAGITGVGVGSRAAVDYASGGLTSSQGDVVRAAMAEGAARSRG